MLTRRLTVLVGVLAAALVVVAIVLQQVFATVFFAVTVAYVLYPVRRWLGHRGLGPRLAAGVATTVAFLAVLALFVPLAAALYFRRDALFALLRQVPETLSVTVGSFSYSVDLATVLSTAQDAAGGLAVSLARSLPALAFKIFLFAFVVYALLIGPSRVREALLRPVPREYHDVVFAFHDRTRSMLYGIYVLQAAVAAGTFVAALPVFFLLGYESTFTLAVLSGILQFIPIIGPSLLILVIGATEAIAGNVNQAILVVVLGLVVIGLLPDVLIRPRLAAYTTDIPAALYFIGFTGGTLSVGLVGLVAGPVAVAWLAEAVTLLSEETGAEETRPTVIDEWTDGPPPDVEAPDGETLDGGAPDSETFRGEPSDSEAGSQSPESPSPEADPFEED